MDLPPKARTKRAFHSHIPYTGRYHTTNAYVWAFLEGFPYKQEKMEEAVKRTNHCVALIERFLSKKLSDPGKFSLPCSIGPLPITFALADLGASVNVMPYNMFQRLQIGNS
ncbi:hypothetical protein L1987_23132 [Smallanthus sonchifolius]|uniref:Uncharacterized protein n=1 Tax=Smallanthus sonchifolius TaxID=185202 RepID=A0ACB9IJF5_9ASTR|nr:hypothetical protein L1987_23132 [Smallanthus sonchifolius]